MYQCLISSRFLLAIGVGLLILSLVLGWISFSVPDWLQFYERNLLNRNTTDNLIDLKKFGLWYKCIFFQNSNDFFCTLWTNDAPTFIRVAQILIPFGLSLGCLALLSACIGFMSRRAFITAVLFSAFFAFLSSMFTTIGVTVFATESLVYVDRLRLTNNDNSRRWGMWLIVPNVVLCCLASICFIVASILNWCDYRNMLVTGMLSPSVDKYSGSVFKAPSESNMTLPLKNPYQYQDYPNGCYQMNGLNNSQQNPITYPPPPSHAGIINPAFQATPPGIFGYSRPASPAMYPHGNVDPYYPRNYMAENSEMDDLSRASRSRRRSRSRRHSDYRSRSHSPRESTITGDNSPKQPQFIPIPVPYYQSPPMPQQQQQTPIISSNPNNNNNQPMTYIMPPTKQQFIGEHIQSMPKATNMLTYGVKQPPLLVSNPNQPVYTIAYRANNAGHMHGPPATTYVTAARNQITEISSLNNGSDDGNKDYQTVTKQPTLKKININEAWTWRKM